MKLTQSRLRQIIKEELQRFVESSLGDPSEDGYTAHGVLGSLPPDDYDPDDYDPDYDDPYNYDRKYDYPDMPRRMSAYDDDDLYDDDPYDD